MSKVRPNPKILTWARETANLDVTRLSERIDIAPNRIMAWERAEDFPTAAQLRSFAQACRRPFTHFFLHEAWSERNTPEDRRSKGIKVSRPLSVDTLAAIRWAHSAQDTAAELMAGLLQSNSPRLRSAEGDSDPQRFAIEFRKHLSITVEEQVSWSSGYTAFREYRKRVEALNILVLQRPMPEDEVSGLAFSDKLPYAILLNSSDSIFRRIFTLFHELYHLLLRDSSICLIDPEHAVNVETAKHLEAACDEFAASILLPVSDEKVLSLFMEELRSQPTLVDAARSIGRSLKVSSQAALVAIHRAELIEPEYFWSSLALLVAESKKRKRSKGGGIKQATKCLSQNGQRYASLVLQAHDAGIINSADVGSRLAISVDAIDEVRARL